MKIFLKDIKKESWLTDLIMDTDWGKVFLNLESPKYFVFHYNLIESISSINIVSAEAKNEINEGIYRNMKAEHIGYMNEPFDSSNYLFYSLLKSATTDKGSQEKLKDLFIGYKTKDIEQNKLNLKTSLSGTLEINSRISFSKALYDEIFFVNEEPVNGLCMVYDLIDQYTKNTTGKTIYGQYLTKIVRAISNPNGGLIPEYANSTMRYLIVGEISSPNDEKLITAKKLLREGNRPYEIYLETGWFFNYTDRKWRKRISDENFYFNIDNFTGEGEEKYYLPIGMPYEKFEMLVQDLSSGKTNMAKAVMDGYNVRLGDIIKFDEAYKYYPKLKDIYAVFAVKFKGLEDGAYDFYFNPSIPYSIVLQSNNRKTINDIKYIALHEIQHYIQEIEGFAQGGNESLANLMDAVGGTTLKSFYISLHNFQKRFDEVATLIDLQEYKDLYNKLSNLKYQDYEIRYQARMINITSYINSMLLQLNNLLSTYNTIQYSSSSISYFILTFYSMIPDSSSIIEDFVNKNIGKDYIELFKQSLLQNKKALERDKNLISKGWTARDLYILNFQAYEALGGELEARFVQQTTKIPQELDNYFKFYTSESIDAQKISVINNSVFDDNKAEAGLETFDGKYVLHLPSTYSNSINILHETGHILYDFVKENILADEEALTKMVMDNYESLEEYFCASFVDYIHRSNIDPLLTKDLDKERQIKNFTYFDDTFTNILYKSERTIDFEGLTERLEFVKKLL